MNDWTSRELTRREAVSLLGSIFAASLQQSLAAQRVFPTAAIVRTVLSDVPPERITGTTLIHEHLSMNADGNNPAFSFYRDLDVMTDEVRACANDGVSCIVDTGHPDLGRSIDIAMTMTNFVPRLRQAGVNDATLHKILVENPRRLLAFVPKV